MNYEELIQERMMNHPFAQFLGMRIDDISEGAARCSMEIHEQLKNPIGSVHGGVLYSLADTAAGCAAISYDGHRMTTVDGSLHFLRAAIAVPRIFARAEVIKKGKRLVTVRVEILDLDGRLLDDGTFTFFDLDAES